MPLWDKEDAKRAKALKALLWHIVLCSVWVGGLLWLEYLLSFSGSDGLMLEGVSVKKNAAFR
jgi:putative copper export protein